MDWQIIMAGLVGVFIAYLYRFSTNDVYNFAEYLFFEWRALVTGIVGAGLALLAWAHVSTVLGWFGVNFEWPPLDWRLAAVVGFAGRHIYKLAPKTFNYIATIFKKKFEA